MCVKVSAGTAYVKGYDVDIDGTEIIDVDKPRDKREVPLALVPYQMGTILKVNNVFGTAVQNINDDTKFVELYNQRTASNSSGTGELIGKARSYLLQYQMHHIVEILQNGICIYLMYKHLLVL